MAALLAEPADDAVVVRPREEPIDLDAFCRRLQEHSDGSSQCVGKDAVMLFGSTGAGKSTLLHLLAGSSFSLEAVEVEEDEDDEFRVSEVDMQLVPKNPIPGVSIGHSAKSTTQLLFTQYDPQTELTYVDTPGFNNVGGAGGDDEQTDDITIDAANSAATMRTIRSCKSLRIVFLINVRDELETKKAGQIKKLFEVMDKFIKDAITEQRLSCVLMLFTHCDGSSADHVSNCLKRTARALPDGLLPFLRKAIALLDKHRDVLLVGPADPDAQSKMDIVRQLLKDEVHPIDDTADALLCPLSGQVLKSLDLECLSRKEAIVTALSTNRFLTEAKHHLDSLHLLCDALHLPNMKDFYIDSLRAIHSHAEKRTQMALEALAGKAFDQVQNSLSTFNCDLQVLRSHMSFLQLQTGLNVAGNVLHDLKTKCLKAINEACEQQMNAITEACDQSRNDFDAVAATLKSIEDMLNHLHMYILERHKDKGLTHDVLEKIEVCVSRNRDKALTMIDDRHFGPDLASVLDAIRRSSEQEELWDLMENILLSASRSKEFRGGKRDYYEITTKLTDVLIGLGNALEQKCSRTDDKSELIPTASLVFVKDFECTAKTLEQIDAAQEYLCSHHLGQEATDSCVKCRKAVSALKDTAFEHLQRAIVERNWQEASDLFHCLEGAERMMGSTEEKDSVKSRLLDIQELARTTLHNTIQELDGYVVRDDFEGFMQNEAVLGQVAMLTPDTLLSTRSMESFKAEHKRLLEKVDAKFTENQQKCAATVTVEQRYADMEPCLVSIEKMAEASVERETSSGCAVPRFQERVASLLREVHEHVRNNIDECKEQIRHLRDTLPSRSEIDALQGSLKGLQEMKKHVLSLQGKIPVIGQMSLFDPCELFSENDSCQPSGTCVQNEHLQTNRQWDCALVWMLESAEAELTKSLEEYAGNCHERCLSSLAGKPKPRSNDVVDHLHVLDMCQNLDPVFAAARLKPAIQKPFAAQREAVCRAVKDLFNDLRTSMDSDVRSHKMSEAKEKLEKAQELLVLRDVFASDSITLDAAVDEMRGNYEQRSGVFAQSVNDALKQERFDSLNTLLQGYRGLTTAAEQEEYNNALTSLTEAGDGKYIMATQIISSISERAEFPPSVEQMAAALRWIGGAKCLGEGESPILNEEVFNRWQSAFCNMNQKLSILKSRESKLAEWKFTSVEDIYRRLSQLLMLRFPSEVSETITSIKDSLSNAMEVKVAELKQDVQQALVDGSHLTVELIFQEVRNSKDNDSSFVTNTIYNDLVGVLEGYLEELVASIKNHYMQYEIEKAAKKQKHLWKLERASVAKNLIARAGLDCDALAEQKKKFMISSLWLRAGHMNSLKEKLDGFRSVDPVRFQSLVSEFMDCLDADVKRLRKVETKADVDEVKQVFVDLPRFAGLLESEQLAFKKQWDGAWNAFFESVWKKLRLASGNDGEDRDISDSLSFLHAARNLLLEHKNDAQPQAAQGTHEGEDVFHDCEDTVLEHNFALPVDDGQLRALIEKLDGLLGHMQVDKAAIDADWTRYVERMDFKTEAKSFETTMNFIRKLKQQTNLIVHSGEYLLGSRPSWKGAISKLDTSATNAIKRLDSNKPDEAVVLIYNLTLFVDECRSITDEDPDWHALLTKFEQHKQTAFNWVRHLNSNLTDRCAQSYAEAQKQHNPSERKRLLGEVRKDMDMQERLHKNLVDRELRALQSPSTSEPPLVAKIKNQVDQLKMDICSSLKKHPKMSSEEVAKVIHDIYMTAFDLGQDTILKHAEECIACVLNDCKGKTGLGLQDLGTVLERDFPQGREIVSNLPQFAEFNVLAFQEMTNGKTPAGTVEEVIQLNKLKEAQGKKLREVVDKVYKSYDAIMRSNQYYFNPEQTVDRVKRDYKASHDLERLIGGVFAVWSLASRTEQCSIPYRPLAPQVVAVVRLVGLDAPSGSSLLDWFGVRAEKSIESSHLAQIKTGEGKSVVLGTLATVLCVAGFKVDCVCYSAYLSGRDFDNFEHVFKHFEVHDKVSYGTFQQLSERLIHDRGDVRAITEELIFGHVAASSKDGMGKKGTVGKEKRILLVDEVDVFFSPSFYGETYDPAVSVKIGPIAEMQRKAWSMRGDTKRILPALKSMEIYETVMREHSDVRAILEGQIAKMIRDLEAWKNGGPDEPYRAYKIIDGKVAYRRGVCYDPKMTFGYMTLWTYFDEVEKKRVAEAVLEENLGLSIMCGRFSYAEIPTKYDLILGVTGTLVPESKNGPHPLGKFEREIIREDYKIARQTQLPSVFGEKKLIFRENEHVSVVRAEDEYNNLISIEVAKSIEGRAVLVFFESEAKLETWQSSSYGQRVPAGTMEVIKSDTRNINMKVRRATHSGQVTLLSREHGRGLDFNCSDKKVEELGGLHVVQTFLSEELSEEMQIRGRTARQKNKGSFQMILLSTDLEKFGIFSKHLEQKDKGEFVPVDDLEATSSASGAPSAANAGSQTLYEFLHGKRAIFLDKSSVTRREAVWCAKALHDQSMRFQRDLLSMSRTPPSARQEELKHRCVKFLSDQNIVKAKCRLLCLSDATSSMSSLWGQSQEGIRTMLERISAISGGIGNVEVKWVAFRDYDLEKSKVLEASPWTEDPASLVKFVGSIQCRGGADYEEAVEAALKYANDEHDPPTRVLLIGDAPPHFEGKGNKLQNLAVHPSNEAPGAFVAGGLLSTDYRCECEKLKEKGVKVNAFFLDAGAQRAFDEIADITEGESKLLDCSEAESLIHAVSETALEDIGGTAMLNKYRATYHK